MATTRIAAKLRPTGMRPGGDALGAFLGRRLVEIAGLGLIALGGAVLVALAGYSPADPSFNHAPMGGAAEIRIRNLLDYPGAVTADLLLQSLGLASIALGLLPLAWGWRLTRDHRVPLLWWRLPLLPIIPLLAAAALGGLTPTAFWPRPLDAGLGGIVGQLFKQPLDRIARAFGFGAELLVIFLAVVAACLLAFALTVTPGEWRATWSGLRRGAAQARRGAGLAAAGLQRLKGWRWRGDDGAEIRASRKEAERRGRLEPRLDGESDDAPEAPAPTIERPRPSPSELVDPRGGETTKRAGAKRQGKLDLPPGGPYRRPPFDLLAMPKGPLKAPALDEAALAQNARMLESVLEDFGVKGRIVKVRPGPVVTLYELEPAPGTKSSRVVGLADDIARSMSAISVRVAVIPGRNVIGIELPNGMREVVYLRELLSGESEEPTPGALTLVLGRDIGGAPVVVDLARMPHLLIAGTTGSGKSVAINTMILSLLYRHGPEDCRFIMVDPKMLELSVYDGIPHLLAPVVTEPKKAVVALKWVVREMEGRYRAMSKLGVRNIAGYNARLAEATRKGEQLFRKVQTGFDEEGKPIFEDQPLDLTRLPFIVVVVDEMADLMLVAGKDIEWAVQRLAQMARAAGIHLIMATQRPSVDVITGTIKANFPTRISFQVTSRIDSRTILGEIGAEQLLGQGDMLYMAGGGRISRVHGPFVSDREVETVVEHLKEQGGPADATSLDFDEEEADLGGPIAGAEDGESGGDQLYDQAVSLVLRERKCSTSFIQRHLQIGYNRAARIVERMEAEGVVGTANHVGKREVLAGRGTGE